MSDAIFIFEIIGTIAFAVSGAMVGLRRQMDLFGIVALGLTTAVGGGVLRDLILGITPPVTFQNPIYAMIAIATSLFVCLPSIRMLISNNPIYYGRLMLITDSIGLGIFTVDGIQIAMNTMGSTNYFLFGFVGFITGCGGGVLRDIMAGEKPEIFRHHFYAMASLIGAALCIAVHYAGYQTYAIIAGTAAVFILRFLAARFCWDLPRPRI